MELLQFTNVDRNVDKKMAGHMWDDATGQELLFYDAAPFTAISRLAGDDAVNDISYVLNV